jgi:hypothetical protein
MTAADLAKGNWRVRSYDVPLPLGQGEVGFVKHERTVL